MALNGTEIMLKSLGLSGVIDSAKQLAESGAVQRILNFSEQVEGINGRLDAIERGLAECLRLLASREHATAGGRGSDCLAGGVTHDGRSEAYQGNLSAIQRYYDKAEE